MNHPASPSSAHAALALELLAGLWRDAGLSADALPRATLTGAEPVLRSSFAIGSMLQASLGAAALAATEIGRLRGGPVQTVTLAALDVARESAARYSLDGRRPEVWDKLSGLYRCGSDDAAPEHVRIHANFAHHRDGALALLGLPTGPATERAQVEAALRGWSAEAFETAAAERGLVVAAVRTPEQWAAHPQAAALAALPLVAIERIGDAPPRAWPPTDPGAPPLHGLRVLELTRILAGPVAGRTLAAHGADVLLVNGPHLPNIENIAETSRGKRSALVDLRRADGRETLRTLASGADVFLQGYRPGGLSSRGFGPEALAEVRPGLVYVSLSAYGDRGPWADRRGFDSLVQSATGLNVAEARALGSAEPRALPLQALDYGAGYLLAFGALVALQRQRAEGGSWHVRVALAGVGRWLQSLPRIADPTSAPAPDFTGAMEITESGYGRLEAVRHAVRFSHTPAAWRHPSMPPGSHPAAW
ncbi:MAG: CoA transferase [Rubrivivax sp.]|jgi:crotonobetainyl-CoA:carnitine CoA-transferase CaiB-like acyl-CoA transferase|nr:CoA transferase [Rubrivivax sp.]